MAKMIQRQRCRWQAGRARFGFFPGAAASASQDFRTCSCPRQREVRARAVDQRLGDLENQSSNRPKSEARSCEIWGWRRQLRGRNMSRLRWHNVVSKGAQVSRGIPRMGSGKTPHSLASDLGTWRNRNLGRVTLEAWTRGPLLNTPENTVRSPGRRQQRSSDPSREAGDR